MKLIIARFPTLGTFVGQIKDDKGANPTEYDFTKIYFPAMVDFITVPAQSPLGKPGFQTITTLSKWPSHQLEVRDFPTLHSIIDIEDNESTTDKQFILLYRAFLKDHWGASGKLVN